MVNYRNLWEKANNACLSPHIEIHHIDGNHNNNNVSNLQAVTIEEHFDIHCIQQDYGACHAILLRMKEDPIKRSYYASMAMKKRLAEGYQTWVMTRSFEERSKQTKDQWAKKTLEERSEQAKRGRRNARTYIGKDNPNYGNGAKISGANNPMYGRSAIKGKRWFTDGISNKYYNIGEEPQGWILGRTLTRS